MENAPELIALAKAEEVELSGQQLEAINSGSLIDWDCPVDFCPLH